MRARILPVGLGGISSEIDRPAHVAEFEINPGWGVSMLSPRISDEALPAFAGLHSVWQSWSYRDGHRFRSTHVSPIMAWRGRAGYLTQPRI